MHYYLVHYIASGKGTFFKNNIAYPMQSGQVFISKPYEVFRFVADEKQPFHYVWVRFTGKTAEKLDTLPSALEVDGTAFLNMLHYDKDSNSVEEYCTSQLYLFFASLLERTERRSDYVLVIKNYIHTHPSGNVTVRELQRLVNLNRQYMSTMFRERAGVSLQQYIIGNRMEKAKLLLRYSSVTETAELCDYANVYAFSKAFKKTVGISPREYRMQNGE